MSGGAPAHPARPTDFSISFNQKQRLFAFKSLLSAKLYEDKILLINSESIDYGKTRYLAELLNPVKLDKVLMVTGFDRNREFDLAQNAIDRLSVYSPQEFSLKHLLKNDFLIFTKEGLSDFENVFESRQANLYRNKKLPRQPLPYDEHLENYQAREEKKIDKYDHGIIKTILEAEETEEDSKPLHLYTPALKGYLRDLEEFQQNASKESV